MSDVQSYLLEPDANKQQAAAIAEKTAQKLASRTLALVDLVESLGEFLNHGDAKIRVKTLAYLADVLTGLPPRFLNGQQRDLLNEFILARIANGAEGLGGCAKALLALEQQGRFDQARVSKITECLLDSTHPLVQFASQSERFAVLTLINTLLAKYRDAMRHLHDSNSQFMGRFIGYFDREKDPRNLMIVFSILHVPMVEWNIARDAQDLFEAVFNYFPITFRPQPDDPYGITSQDLKDRLRGCIAASSLFAPHAFPALLDKLDSTSINVKRDALQALTSCASNYGPATMDSYSVTLWDSLKYEVLNAQEEDLAEEALLVLQAIASQLSSSPHNTSLQSFIKPVAKECNEHLEETPTKQSAGAGQILSSISEASPEASSQLNLAVLPHLLALYRTSDSLPRRRGLLEVLNRLLKSSIVVFGRWRDIKSQNISNSGSPSVTLRTVSNPFSEHVDSIVDAFTVSLTRAPITEVSFRLLALDGLHNLVVIRQLLNDTGVGGVIRLLDDIVINEESYGKDELKAAAMDALVDIAHQKPQLITEIAIPEFMARLPDTDSHQAKPYLPVLEAFAKLSNEQQIFKTLIIRLKNKFYTAVLQDASPSFVQSVLSAILYAFSNGASHLEDPAMFGSYYQDIVISFLKDVFTPQGALHGRGSVMDDVVVDLLGRICNVILRAQPWVAQTEICRNIYTLFRDVDLSEVAPFSASDPSPQNMFVSTHLLAAMQRDASPHIDIGQLFTATINFASNDSILPSIQAAAIRQTAVLANKFIPLSSKDSNAPDLMTEHLDGLLRRGSASFASLHIAFAMLKGAVIRHPIGTQMFCDYFLPFVSDPTLSLQCARAFSSLFAPDDLLTKENHCRVYSLYKQRFFTQTFPRLSETFRSSDSSEITKRNVLIALSGIVYWLPYDLLRHELPKLVPLLLQSLTLEDVDTISNTITILEKVVHEDPRLIEEHIGSLIRRLLDVAITAASTNEAAVSSALPKPSSRTNPPKTRTAALACLSAFGTTFRTELLLPHKQTVVKNLTGALDDGRRAVRSEAVRCRRNWLNLGGGDADDDDDE